MDLSLKSRMVLALVFQFNSLSTSVYNKGTYKADGHTGDSHFLQQANFSEKSLPEKCTGLGKKALENLWAHTLALFDKSVCLH